MTKLALPTRNALRFDGDSSTVNYVGEASFGSNTADACWRIKKITITGASLSITWADGNDAFDNVWDNRTSLTYL